MATGPSALDRQVGDYLAHLEVERGLAAHTITAYRRDLTRYLTALDDAGIDRFGDVDRDRVTAFVRSLTDGVPARPGRPAHPPLAASSTARTVVAVRNLHRFLLAEGLVEVDVTADVTPPRPGSRLPKAIGIEAVQTMLEVPDVTTVVGLRDRCLLELLYGTGARVSEILALDVDDLAFIADDPQQRRGLRLLGKGDKERVVPLGSYARDAVAGWLVRGRPELIGRARRPGPALLLNSRGARLSRQSAWTVLSEIGRAAGVGQDVSPHTLRHSYATHLLDGGADVRVVQELLGHASVTTTQLYTMVTVDRLREAYLTAHPRAY